MHLLNQMIRWMDGWINKEMDYRHIDKWTDSLTTEDR